MRSSSPSRLRPAAASTKAENCPSSSLRRRVSTLPRTGATATPGNSARICTARRAEAQPMGLEGSSSSAPWGSTSTSRGSSRREKPARGMRGSSSMGRSLQLWTVRSTRPSSRAASSSLTKRPLPPTLSRVRSSILSPVVFMVTSSSPTSGWAARMASITSSDCTTASRLSRLPTRMVFIPIPPMRCGWPGPPGRCGRGRRPGR